MKNEPLLAVEESQPKEIAVSEVQKRADKERQAVPALLEPQGPLVGVAQQPRVKQVPGAVSPLELLFGLGPGVFVVLVDPEANGVFVSVVFDDIVAQLAGRPVHVEAVFELLVVAAGGAAAEQLEHVFGVIT